MTSTTYTAHHYPFYERVMHWFIPHAKNGYRPHALRHQALAVYSLILIAAKVGITISLFLTFPNEAVFSTLTAQRIVDLTNQARQRVGLAPLVFDERLTRSATLKADDMASSGYFAHRSPKGDSPWEWFKKAGYEYTYAGENLAMDFREAEGVVEAWMESPKHRENVLNPKYRDIGIAVVTGKVNGKMATLVVQHFGTTFVRIAKTATARAAPSVIERGVRGEATTVAVAKAEVVLTAPKSTSLSAGLLTDH